MKVLLKTKILMPESDSLNDVPCHLDHSLEHVTLRWKQGRLWVTNRGHAAIEIPALKSKQWLEDCLQHSNIKGICLDPYLNDEYLRTWADACKSANKTVFLRLASSLNLSNYCHSLNSWYIKRILDWWVAALLLLVLSPIMLALMVFIKITSSGPVFLRQWHVGRRGKLFKVVKFRTMVEDTETLHLSVRGEQQRLYKCQYDPRITPLGRFLRKYNLDELPQLFNVLSGEMSLVGPRPLTLYDAVRISPKDQCCLRALPGITGLWQVTRRSHVGDLDTVIRFDLEYLQSWSLRKDFRILLLTIPKVLSGFGAY